MKKSDKSLKKSTNTLIIQPLWSGMYRPFGIFLEVSPWPEVVRRDCSYAFGVTEGPQNHKVDGVD